MGSDNYRGYRWIECLMYIYLVLMSYIVYNSKYIRVCVYIYTYILHQLRPSVLRSRIRFTDLGPCSKNRKSLVTLVDVFSWETSEFIFSKSRQIAKFMVDMSK